MANLLRSRVILNWDNGGPGVCTYYASAGVPNPLDWRNTADQWHDELAQVWTLMSGVLLSSVTWRMSQDFDLIDVETGNIVDQFSTDGTPITGQGTDPNIKVSRAQMLYLRFKTDQWQNGRRLAGGTFFGPVGGRELMDNGQWPNNQLAAFEEHFTALISGPGPRLAVYHRPPRGTSSGGYYGDVTSIRAKAKPGTLRSRRD